MWNEFVDVIRAAIFSASHVCGGSIGGGILLVSFAVRLGLLPLTLRLARRALAQQRKLAQLAPEIQRIQQRFAKDPARLMQATQSLYKRHDVRLLDPRSLFGSLAQWPLFAGLFSAVRRGLGAKTRFLWIADLATPNVALVLGVSALAAAAAALTPTPAATARTTTMWMGTAALMTVLFLASTSSALALSVATGSVVSGLQNWLVRREMLRAAR